MIPLFGGFRHQNAVITQGHPFGEGIFDNRVVLCSQERSAIIVRNTQLRLLEPTAIDVNNPFLGFDGPCVTVFRRSCHGMTFAPHPHMTNIDKSHMRATIITFGHCPDKMVNLLQIDRIIIIGFIDPPLGIETFGSGIEHPLGCCFVHPRFKSRDTKRHLQPLIDPTLGRGIKTLPQETTLLRFNQGPRQS